MTYRRVGKYFRSFEGKFEDFKETVALELKNIFVVVYHKLY